MITLAYGITTAQVAVGLSAVIAVNTDTNVLGRKINFISGGTLFVTGQSLAVASMITTGTHVQSAAYTEIMGPANFYMAAGGATVVAHIMTFLKQGYAGQY